MTTPSPQAELLGRFLADHDAACPNCAYNLRGLQAGQCPECGTRIELRIASLEGPARWFITGVVLASCVLGFYGIAALFGVGVMVWEWSAPPWQLVVVLGPGLVGSALLLAAWLRRRRRIGKLSRAGRWMAVAAVGVMALVLAVMIWVMVVWI